MTVLLCLCPSQIFSLNIEWIVSPWVGQTLAYFLLFLPRTSHRNSSRLLFPLFNVFTNSFPTNKCKKTSQTNKHTLPYAEWVIGRTSMMLIHVKLGSNENEQSDNQIWTQLCQTAAPEPWTLTKHWSSFYKLYFVVSCPADCDPLIPDCPTKHHLQSACQL